MEVTPHSHCASKRIRKIRSLGFVVIEGARAKPNTIRVCPYFKFNKSGRPKIDIFD